MNHQEPERERKERVIHTRIPNELEGELKRLADALRMPVSNLVRNILHDTMVAVDRIGRSVEELVGEVTNHVGTETEQLRRTWARYEARRPLVVTASSSPSEASPAEPAPGSTDPLGEVYGFQPVVLNIATACAVCRRPLDRGIAAHVGLTDRPGRRLFVCDDCLPRPESQA